MSGRWWAPGGGFLACRGDGAIHVHAATGRATWSVPEAPGAGASLSADGQLLAHVVDGGPCVHRGDGTGWAKPRIQASRALVTDDGSLVVAVGRNGSAVLDAATGERLDPPRSPPRPIGWATGPGGEVAAITTDGEVEAWDAFGRSLGRRVLPPAGTAARTLSGMLKWDRHLDWTDLGLCASHHGYAVCVDPRDDWQTTLQRTGTGVGTRGHLVGCKPFSVDGVEIPGLSCGGYRPKLTGDRGIVVVARDGSRDAEYLDVESLAFVGEPPRGPPVPEPRPSRGG